MTTAFPANIIETLASPIANLPGVENVQQRTINPDDPNGTVGVWAGSWAPREQDWQIGAPEPLGRYSIFIGSVTTSMEESAGLAASSALLKSIRVMLYRDANLQLALRQLSESSLGVTERVSRIGVKESRFLDANITVAYLYMAVTELWVETEIA